MSHSLVSPKIHTPSSLSMDITADDNFFIEEPQKLRNSFFNQDKSIQMVEMLTPKHLGSNVITSTNSSTNNNNNIGSSNRKRVQFDTIHQQSPQQQQQQQPPPLTTCRRLSYNNNKMQLLQHASTAMPKSLITRLELLCQSTHDTDDISVAKQAMDTLVGASKVGCCFLEKYIVILLNYCTNNDHLANDSMKIKIEELLNRVLTVDFDRQQLTENLRRPEYKLKSMEQIILLLRRVQDMLDYREQTAINWLIVLFDAYFVELATMDEATEIIDQISAHIDSRCALLSQTEDTKCLLKSILELLGQSEDKRSSCKSIIESRILTPYYSIDYIEI